MTKTPPPGPRGIIPEANYRPAPATPRPARDAGEIRHVTIDERGEAKPVPRDVAALFRLTNKAIINDRVGELAEPEADSDAAPEESLRISEGFHLASPEMKAFARKVRMGEICEIKMKADNEALSLLGGEPLGFLRLRKFSGAGIYMLRSGEVVRTPQVPSNGLYTILDLDRSGRMVHRQGITIVREDGSLTSVPMREFEAEIFGFLVERDGQPWGVH